MPGRNREFDIDTATEVAMNVFWDKGYSATSLHDLIDAMALSKSSFYQAFDSKQALFERCVKRYEHDFVDVLADVLATAPSGYGFLHSALHQVAEETRGPNPRRGCLVMNTAGELAQRDKQIASSIARAKSRMRAILQKAIARAQAEGDIDSSRDSGALADYLLTCMTGLKTLIKAGETRAAIDRVIDVIIEGL